MAKNPGPSVAFSGGAKSPIPINQRRTEEMLYRTLATAPVFGLRREIDRLFDDAFSRDGLAWTPAADIKENDSELRVELELPGLKPEDVEITAENGVLSIRGEKQAERKEGNEDRMHVVERTYGSFFRSFQLPQGVDESKIEAEFEHGVLTVRIPKAALPQPRKIQIGAGNGKKQARVSEGSKKTAEPTGAAAQK
jgi:HSP20 family protein